MGCYGGPNRVLLEYLLPTRVGVGVWISTRRVSNSAYSVIILILIRLSHLEHIYPVDPEDI